ncbi:MAG: kelch repeat-containing protein [Planctomycetota bacterium]
MPSLEPWRRQLCGATLIALSSIATAQDWSIRQGLTPRMTFGAAADTARQRVVVAGGFATSTTAEWDGVSWVSRTGTEPPWATGTAMTYDAARSRVLAVLPAPVAATWAWDGAEWRRLVLGTTPGTQTHAMAFDPRRGRVVLFGSRLGGTTVLAETWEWDGVRWEQIPAPAMPPPRSGHKMFWDGVRQRIALIGGARGGFYGHRDHWEWDGQRWTQLSASIPPIPRKDPGVTYDPRRGRTVLYGGAPTPAAGGPPLADQWEWDGTSWTELTPSTTPGPRTGHELVYDPTTDRLLLVGGSADGTDIRNDTWAWDGTAWSEVAAGGWPMAAGFAPLAYDAARDRVVQFGGLGPTFRQAVGRRTPILGTTWEWDGVRWHQRTPSTAPPARFRHGTAYDAARAQVLIFGGSAGADGLVAWFHGRPLVPPTNDLWAWDGSSGWIEQQPVGERPAPRHTPAMAYDTQRQSLFLFGGDGGVQGSRTQLFGDLWAWTGTAWARASASGPAARRGSAMAYDSRRRRLVLFGGHTASAPVTNDTWEWDGTAWLYRAPATSPPPRRLHAMTYDPTLGAVLLHGGIDADPFGLGQIRSDVWAWDGTDWRPLSTTAPASHAHGWAFDTRRRLHVSHLGISQPPSLAGADSAISLFGNGDTLATTELVGTGCTLLPHAPALAAFGLPVLGRGAFALEVIAAPPQAVGASLWSLGLGSVPLGACTLWLDPATLFLAAPFSTNATGNARLALPIPATASLAGLELAVQAGAQTPIGPFAGSVFTNAQRLSLGH